MKHYCEEHPNESIEHSYDLIQPILNGYPAGTGYKTNHRYTCHACGKELASLAQASALAMKLQTEGAK